MMLESCYAVFATSILNSVSFHCFLAHVELEKELFAAWNQVPWPCKGRISKTTTGYMDGLSNQEKRYAKKLYLLTFVLNRSRFLGYKQSLLLMPGYKTVEDAFDCDRHRVETFGLVSGF